MSDEIFITPEGRKRRLKDIGGGFVAPEVVLAVVQDSESTAIGDPTDPPWNGTDASASLISIMKASYLKLAVIAENTGG